MNNARRVISQKSWLLPFSCSWYLRLRYKSLGNHFYGSIDIPKRCGIWEDQSSSLLSSGSMSNFQSGTGSGPV